MHRVLLLLKRSVREFHEHQHPQASIPALHQVPGILQDRRRVHEMTVQTCKNVLENLNIHWKSLFPDELREPINDVDLVITIGGDGTLLRAGHFLDSSIPVLAVNSDPTQMNEVEEKLDEFDATRSAGYLCAATNETFKQVLEEILEGKRLPIRLPRLSVGVDSTLLQTYALNDILIAHPNPAAVTRCTFSIHKRCSLERVSPLVHARSSGLRICTGAGSTGAMRSAGGYIMPQSSTELQFMVREPIAPHPLHQQYMHRFVKSTEMLQIKLSSRQGNAYFDGSHIHYPVHFSSVINISLEGPYLQVF